MHFAWTNLRLFSTAQNVVVHDLGKISPMITFENNPLCQPKYNIVWGRGPPLMRDMCNMWKNKLGFVSMFWKFDSQIEWVEPQLTLTQTNKQYIPFSLKQQGNLQTCKYRCIDPKFQLLSEYNTCFSQFEKPNQTLWQASSCSILWRQPFWVTWSLVE